MPFQDLVDLAYFTFQHCWIEATFNCILLQLLVQTRLLPIIHFQTCAHPHLFKLNQVIFTLLSSRSGHSFGLLLKQRLLHHIRCNHFWLLQLAPITHHLLLSLARFDYIFYKLNLDQIKLTDSASLFILSTFTCSRFAVATEAVLFARHRLNRA